MPSQLAPFWRRPGPTQSISSAAPVRATNAQERDSRESWRQFTHDPLASSATCEHVSKRQELTAFPVLVEQGLDMAARPRAVRAVQPRADAPPAGTAPALWVPMGPILLDRHGVPPGASRTFRTASYQQSLAGAPVS
jgi:hypothetical protein